MWELTIVGVIAMLCLGLLAGAGGTSRAAETRRVVRICAITVGVVAIVAASLQLPPLLSEQRLEASRAAAARGHLQRAATEARRARVLEPWAATPYVQLALIEEQAGDLRGANALASCGAVARPVRLANLVRSPRASRRRPDKLPGLVGAWRNRIALTRASSRSSGRRPSPCARAGIRRRGRTGTQLVLVRR